MNQSFQTQIGKKIKDIRKRLGLSQPELAKEVGLEHGQIISQIEKGKREIKAWELAQIAKVLMVSISELLDEKPFKASPKVLWREKQVGPKVLKKEGEFIKACKDYRHLEELAGIETLPKLDCTEKPPFNYRKAERLAIAWQKRLNLGAKPAYSLERVLENDLQIKIFYFDLSECGSAACVADDFGYAILINRQEAPWRRIYSLTHEFFHLITWSAMQPSEYEDGNMVDVLETCANVFASALLLPTDELRVKLEEKLRQQVIRVEDLINLAREFGISTEALLWRLVNLGIVAKESVKKLTDDPSFKAQNKISRKGTQGELPSLPDRYVLLAVSALHSGKISKTKFAEYMKIKPWEIDDFLQSYGLSEDKLYDAEISTTIT